MKTKYDFLGRPLQVGDPVIYMDTTYKQLHQGRIKKLNNVKATIERYDDGIEFFGDSTVRDYSCIIKVIELVDNVKEKQRRHDERVEPPIGSWCAARNRVFKIEADEDPEAWDKSQKISDVAWYSSFFDHNKREWVYRWQNYGFDEEPKLPNEGEDIYVVTQSSITGRYVVNTKTQFSKEKTNYTS